MLSSFRYITEMAGADEKAIVLDELIQVAKYSNMRKTKSTQPDHDTECSYIIFTSPTWTLFYG
jgi:hypothetical protein